MLLMYDNLFPALIVEFYCPLYSTCAYVWKYKFKFVKETYVIKSKSNPRCKFLTYGNLILK